MCIIHTCFHYINRCKIGLCNSSKMDVLKGVIIPFNDYNEENKVKIGEKKLIPTIDENTKILTKLREKRKKYVNRNENDNKYELVNTILDGLSTNQAKANILLKWLLTRQKIITWDNNRTLILYNTPIPNTDMVAIVRNALQLKQNPQDVNGATAFYHALADVNIPSNLISNTKGKKIIQKI